MSIEYITSTYQVPAAIGARVEYTGGANPVIGTITGAEGAHLLITLEGQERARRFHPTWELRYLDTSDLVAFAPDGNKIRGTLEHASAVWEIQHFYLNDGGKFVHEFSDNGPGGVDTETADIKGQTLYVDHADKIWPESALTFKTKDGVVVRKGVDMVPLKWPDLDQAITAYYCEFTAAAHQLKVAPEPAERALVVSKALAEAAGFLEAVAGTLDWAMDHGASAEALRGMQAFRARVLSQVRAAQSVETAKANEGVGSDAFRPVDRPRG